MEVQKNMLTKKLVWTKDDFQSSNPKFPHWKLALFPYFKSPTKFDWVKQFSTWQKCCFFVYENFLTHNFRIRDPHYFFILETCVMASLSVWAKKCEISSPLDSRDARFELWRFDFSQKATSLSKAWRSANSVWTVFEPISWMNCFKFSSPFDSRDVRFWLWRFDFSQKAPSFSKASRTASSFWTNCVEWILSNFLLHTILEMPISGSEGLNSFKRLIAEKLLEKKNGTCRRTCKTNIICILTRKWKAANNFFDRS